VAGVLLVGGGPQRAANMRRISFPEVRRVVLSSARAALVTARKARASTARVT
jgi:hypothetical protein